MIPISSIIIVLNRLSLSMVVIARQYLSNALFDQRYYSLAFLSMISSEGQDSIFGLAIL